MTHRAEDGAQRRPQAPPAEPAHLILKSDIRQRGGRDTLAEAARDLAVGSCVKGAPGLRIPGLRRGIATAGPVDDARSGSWSSRRMLHGSCGRGLGNTGRLRRAEPSSDGDAGRWHRRHPSPTVARTSVVDRPERAPRVLRSGRPVGYVNRSGVLG
jgi:hypothetical protein